MSCSKIADIVSFRVKCIGQTRNKAIKSCVEIRADAHKGKWSKYEDKMKRLSGNTALTYLSL